MKRCVVTLQSVKIAVTHTRERRDPWEGRTNKLMENPMFKKESQREIQLWSVVTYTICTVYNTDTDFLVFYQVRSAQGIAHVSKIPKTPKASFPA